MFVTVGMIPIYQFLHYCHFTENKIIKVKDYKKEQYFTISNNQSVIRYMFLVRSGYSNIVLRDLIRKYWQDGYSERENSDGSKNSQLLFLLEASAGNATYNITEEWNKRNDILLLEFNIEELVFLKSLPIHSRFLIISQDTTFVNFNNLVNLLKQQGKMHFNCNTVLQYYT